MNVRQDMRASDHDRQQGVDVLPVGLEDGRRPMEDAAERLGRASQAVPHAALAQLPADLPAAGPPAPGPPAPGPPAPGPGAAPRPAVTGPRGAFAGLPAPLRVLWAIWLSVV